MNTHLLTCFGWPMASKVLLVGAKVLFELEKSGCAEATLSGGVGKRFRESLETSRAKKVFGVTGKPKSRECFLNNWSECFFEFCTQIPEQRCCQMMQCCK